MPDRQSVQGAGRHEPAAAAGRGQARGAGAAPACGRAPPCVEAEPLPEPARRAARRRAEPARAGGQPAAAARRPAARIDVRRWTSTACAATRSRRFAGSRNRPARRAWRTRSSSAARYVLCAGLDEAVLSTPWGAQSEWAQHPLLVALHREAWGGEKFFEMLDRISTDPARYLDLMELQYLCLALGFGGKYQVHERGPRAPRRHPAGSLSHDPRAPRPTSRPSCRCGGAGSRTVATRSSGTCRGGSSAQPRWRCWPSPSPSTTRRSPASPPRCRRSSPRSALEDFSRPVSRARPRPAAQAAAGARRKPRAC